MSEVELSFEQPHTLEAVPDDPRYESPLRQIKEEEPDLFETPGEELPKQPVSRLEKRFNLMTDQSAADKLRRVAIRSLEKSRDLVLEGEGLDAENKVKNMKTDVEAAEDAVATLSQAMESLKVEVGKLEGAYDQLDEARAVFTGEAEANPYGHVISTLDEEKAQHLE